jgi:hypothetical protein
MFNVSEFLSKVIYTHDLCRYALEVLNEDELCINEPFRPLGLVYSKARQLQKLKYQPVLVRLPSPSSPFIFFLAFRSIQMIVYIK